jgi:hypothetical protein
MKIILPLLCLCFAVSLLAGCINPFEPALVLPTMTPVPTTTPVPATTPLPTTTPDLNPRPTSVIPSLYTVSIQIQKNPVATNPWISVVYEGSVGRALPSRVDTTVIRPDGITEQKSARNPPRGTQIIINGTPYADRVIVNVTYMDGSSFTVRDELIPLRTAAER